MPAWPVQQLGEPAEAGQPAGGLFRGFGQGVVATGVDDDDLLERDVAVGSDRMR